MPTNDQNGVIGSTPTNAEPNTSVPQDISDLGDILMEKTLDATQGSDFVGVKPSDVDLLSTTNSSIATDASQATAVATPSTNESLDLGDISLEDLTTPIVANPAPVVEEPKMDLNSIESISIPEATPVAINQESTIDQSLENNNTDTPNIATSSVEASPIPDASLESLSTDLAPEIVPTPETVPVSENSAAVEQLQVEVAPIIKNTQIADETPTVDVSGIVEETAAAESMQDATNQEVNITPSEAINTPIIEQPQAEQVADDVAEVVPVSQVNIEEKMAEVQAASQEIEGLDLDSLVSQSSAEEIPPSVSPTPVKVEEPTVIATTPKNNKKQMGLMLGLLGVVAVAGLGYFGYKTMYPVGVDGPVQTGSNDTGGIPMIITGDVFAETGNNVMSGNVDTGSLADSGSVVTGSITTGNDTGNIIEEPIISYDSIVQSGNDLASRVRKLLIKATINKDGPARITAFGIQKDIEAFQQALEKITDISTLSNVTGVIAGFSQRLDSLAQKLDGTSNQ